ncbi:FtsB family cell division protein [Nocardioides sp. Bht2]|uniref:FtsB family cell division protein n=1 Tax=Nocardioides sp. Bht2 TaxID=3392297 RepID=UPI0039B54613
MADRRNDRENGPRGSRRPANPRGARPRAAAAGRPTGRSAPGATAPRENGKAKPKLTGRAAILLVVLTVLAVSYASSMRAWMQQREHIADLRAQIDKSESQISKLEREKRRLDDDAYVVQQARERFNYVFPGEKSYRVLDENGDPVDLAAPLPDAPTPEAEVPPAWWDTAWQSVQLAGNPPTDEEAPAEKLEAPKQ